HTPVGANPDYTGAVNIDTIDTIVCQGALNGRIVSIVEELLCSRIERIKSMVLSANPDQTMFIFCKCKRIVTGETKWPARVGKNFFFLIWPYAINYFIPRAHPHTVLPVFVNRSNGHVRKTGIYVIVSRIFFHIHIVRVYFHQATSLRSE